ncbi:DUF5723 family protein [Oceanihabitans sp. 2_MG-2023]|uniref:DUF5723 family protein n=1 Tax=Oceanihabitans sp. 2_MG-2023 TaxID=3062661 RepID=UPI0026E29B0D|nr:DUF5723 family protein [Oceanihabitans sp. 2_MG-2023]MDO6597849.1 DUF5723 family protein [Oceanihabitans sp. 2_MG-2023]
MKKISLLLFLSMCFVGFAQNKQLLYGFSEIPQSLQLNPGGQITNDWYIGIPFLSHIHANFGMTGLSIYDVFADDGTDFNTKLKSTIYAMKETDYFALNEQYDLFSGGFAFGNGFIKNKYLSFGMYQETNAFIYFPKDYAILAYEGNHDNINRIFDLSDLNVSAELLTVFHLGYNKKVNNKFTYGVRGKIYSSILDVKSINNKGTFVTTEGESNFLNHDFILDLELQTAGLKSFLDDENSDISQDMKTLISRAFFGGNLGVGVDIGFTYKLTEQWTLEASIQDIGFISYKKDVENFNLDGNLTYEGINPLFQESEEGQTAEEYWDAVATDFEDLFQVDTTYTKYKTARPIKFNAALQYAFGKKNNQECNCLQVEEDYQNRVGAHLFLMQRPKKPQTALTAFYYRNLFSNFGVKASYTLDSYSYTNLGLALSANISGLHFYVAADNLLKYQNLAKAQSVSLQLGFNYIFKNNEK